ncbi:MAG: hypothetical protein WB780_17105 [Candidatus Acidiferrales bacterium]
MTRRGSLIYYLSAWILGCFFMTAAVWLSFGSAGGFRTEPALHQVSGLLFFYFYGLELGALPALIFAFLLRKIASTLKCKTPWHWAIFGAILSPLLVVALGHLGLRFGSVTGNGWQPVDWFTSGPQLVLVFGWWLAIPAGAITAFLLCRIERAFAPQPQAAASASGHA